MSFYRVALVALAALFSVSMTSFASAHCCHPGHHFHHHHHACGGCGPVLAPIQPQPIAVDHWDRGGYSACGGCGAWMGCGGCASWHGCGGCASWHHRHHHHVAHVPIYLVDLGPDFTGPGIMEAYRYWSPTAGAANPAEFPYIAGRRPWTE